MSFLKSLKPNKPTVSLEGYFVAMLAKSKFGKTTFAVDLAKEFYGNLDSTLLLGCEIGYKTMAGVYAVPIVDFEESDKEYDENGEEIEKEEKGFIEVVDQLIEDKADIPFRFIIIDTITALERYAISYVIKKANRDDQPQKRYTDISDIPWGKGYTMVSEVIYEQIDRLKKASYGVFIIGHEKTKKTKNRDGFEYDYTTFNVLTKTSDIIEREADMIIYGDMMTEKGEKGKLVTTRKLRFRSDGNILCGARFRNFPAELPNDVSVFIETFKNAVLGLYDGDEEAVAQAEQEQKEKAESKAQEFVNRNVEDKNAENSIDDVKAEIAGILKGLKPPVKKECAVFFKENLGNVDYRKSDDVEALIQALDYVRSKV